MEELTAKFARQIIERVGSSGAPPEWGFQLFTAGLDQYLNVLEQDYLKTFIKDGGASFKLVIGAYGGGKTHFLYNIREVAWRNNYVVSYCSLSPEESPFYRLEKVYKTVIENLARPLSAEELFAGKERGIEAFLKAVQKEASEPVKEYPSRITEGIENINFMRAVREAVRALAEEKREDFEDLIQWLKVDGYDRQTHKRFGILQPIDKGQALSALRSLIQWIRNLKYNGLVILFDEAELIPSLTSKQRELMLNNIRELIDECGHAAFTNVMIFYAIPSEAFFEGKAGVYEALRQRISTAFDFFNPTGVKINLEKLGRDPESLLSEIGGKLFRIYETAFSVTFSEEKKNEAIMLLAQAAYEQRFGDIGYKRLFVQALIRGLHMLRHDPSANISKEWAMDMVQG
ncbi:MAG: BREX system ATP-binding domain-containing protein [Pseudomonadota bacterium]